MSNMEIAAEGQPEAITNSVPLQEASIARSYLGALFWWIAAWAAVFLLFIWIIDPYGVSPIQVNLSGMNVNKPRRLDIDRLIKPYEVWRYQPKTVFLGTSRIHQSIDPSVFDGTEFAPAYNAAIPASTLTENAAHIEQFFKLDPHIKDIFIELFFYNFTTEQSPQADKTWKEFLNNFLSLQISSDALFDAMRTFHANRKEGAASAHVAKLGYRVYSNDFNPASTFNDLLFIQTVLSWDRAAKTSLQPTALESLDRIVNFARSHKIHLHMLLTPNYPWDDYRLMSLGYWPMLETWLRKMAAYSDVVSFSQYNTFLEETPVLDPPMKWWNDPIHFSLNMGHAMMLTYLGHPDKGTPANLMHPLNPQTVESVIAERRAGALHWAAMHPDFVEKFEEAKTISDTVQGEVNSHTLSVNGHDYPLRLGVGEIAFSSQQGDSLLASGWAADEVAKRHTKQLIATIGSAVVAQAVPTVKREDISYALGNHAIESGFNIAIPLTKRKASEPIRVFALMKDGHAVQLTSQDPLIEGAPISSSLGLIEKNKIILGNKFYPIVEHVAGAIENVIKLQNYSQVHGWAADSKANAPVAAIIAARGVNVVAKTLPTVDRDDLTHNIAANAKPAEFIINIPNQQGSSEVRLFALLENGTAASLGVAGTSH